MFYYISFQVDAIPFLFILSEEQLYEKGQFTEICKLGGGTVISSQIEVNREQRDLLCWEQLKEEDVLIVEQQIINDMMSLTASFDNVSVVNC